VISETVVRAVQNKDLEFSVSIGPHSVIMDYPLTPGDAGAGAKPMDMLLAALAACAGGSVAALLRRTESHLSGLTVIVRGLRRAEHPTVFTQIAIEFEVHGSVDETTVAKALKQAETHICPIWAMLKPAVPITSSFRIVAA
jgi:putative redox protein